MQENKIKLIAIDLDGTLLNRKGQIDEPTAKAVRKATKQGTVIVISTGRPIEEVPEEKEEEFHPSPRPEEAVSEPSVELASEATEIEPENAPETDDTTA